MNSVHEQALKLQKCFNQASSASLEKMAERRKLSTKHFDLRNRDAERPGLQVVLEIKASPNYTDIKGTISKCCVKRLGSVPGVMVDGGFVHPVAAGVSFVSSSQGGVDPPPSPPSLSIPPLSELLRAGRLARPPQGRALLPRAPSPSLIANDFPTPSLIRINREALILPLELSAKSQCSETAETELFLLRFWA